MKITAKVHPRSKKLRFEMKGKVLHCYLTKPATKNQANLQLIKELRKRFPGSRVIGGFTSKNKKLEIPMSLNTLQKNHRL